MKRPIALLFPGQGSQYIGMGNRYLSSPFFKLADSSLNFSLSDIIFNGPVEVLNLTKFTQPAILTYSIILLEELKKYNLEVDYVLGHSLGEYSALVAASSLTFADAIKAVHLRGLFMQEAVPEGLGKMYALLGSIPENISSLCKDIGEVNVANYNDPSQVVISGMAKSTERLISLLKDIQPTGLKVLELKVSAPFHSPLMKSASLKLMELFSSVTVRENTIPYIANVDGNIYPSNTLPSRIKNNLIEQVASSVLWTQSFSKLPDHTLCIEVGPGKVLTGLAKKIKPNIQVINLDSSDGFSNLEKALE